MLISLTQYSYTCICVRHDALLLLLVLHLQWTGFEWTGRLSSIYSYYVCCYKVSNLCRVGRFMCGLSTKMCVLNVAFVASGRQFFTPNWFLSSLFDLNYGNFSFAGFCFGAFLKICEDDATRHKKLKCCCYLMLTVRVWWG